MTAVLHTEWSTGFGGQELRILAEAQGLRERGHRVEIACQPGSLLQKHAEELKIPTHSLKMRHHFDPFALAKLIQIIHKQKFEIVSTHSYVDSYLASLAARLLGKVGIVRTRHLNVPTQDSLIYRLPHRIVTTSESIRENILKQKHLPNEKIVSIPTGVDLNRFNPALYQSDRIRREFKLLNSIPVIGTVAFLRRMKGISYLIQAAAQVLKEFPEARFMIVGSGFPKLEKELKNLAADLGIESKVIFTGYRKDIPEIFSALNVFVLPSIHKEGVPQAILQAFAMGKPVVSTRFCEQFCEKAEGKIARWVPAADSDALTSGILKIIRNPDESAAMGKRARTFIEQKFSLTQMIDRMEVEYARLRASFKKNKFPKEQAARFKTGKNISYQSYQDYLVHQKEKTSDPKRRAKWLNEDWEPKIQDFQRAFLRHEAITTCHKALCLGARTGQEVQALKNIGLDAIGIDLVSCVPRVIEADFHKLPFHDGIFDFVFSNSYDHALFPDQFAGEIERVLTAGGYALLHFQVGKSIQPRHYDVTFVGDSNEPIRFFSSLDLLVSRSMENCLGMNWEILMRKRTKKRL